MKKQVILMSMLAVSILSFVGCQSSDMNEPAGAERSSTMESRDTGLSAERGTKGTGAAAHGSADHLRKASTNDVYDSTSPEK